MNPLQFNEQCLVFTNYRLFLICRNKNSRKNHDKTTFMKNQNFQNHEQIVFGYHRVGSIAIIIAIIGSAINLYQSTAEDRLAAFLILLNTFTLLIVAAYTRLFPLKAQDRAIRAEENLRYYAMTGKLFPKELKISQIIALRFAPDEEFIALTERAVAENLKAKDIKKAIKNWKADYHRV